MEFTESHEYCIFTVCYQYIAIFPDKTFPFRNGTFRRFPVSQTPWG